MKTLQVKNITTIAAKNLLLALLLIVGIHFSSKADPPATHGMVLFGEKNLYLSHLPMFHAPHDYQVILKVTMQDPKGVNIIEYYKSKIEQKYSLFTIAPKVMDLSKIINGQIKQFKATVFEGHFEKNGKPLGNLNFTIDDVVFAKKLNPSETEKNQYLVFGDFSYNEFFASHLIDGKPSIDAIYQTTGFYSISDQKCKRRECGSNYYGFTKKILQSKSAFLKPGNQLGDFKSSVKILNQLYFEKDELSH